MSLWPIKTVASDFGYILYDGREITGLGGLYNAYLITPPRLYENRVFTIGNFFYEPSNDRLVAYAFFEKIVWPGWDALRSEWDPETGALVKQTYCGYGPLYFSGRAGLGSYNKMFAAVGNKINEVPWDTLVWVSPMWTINPQTWTPPASILQAVVNLQDSLIAGVEDWFLKVWDISGTPALRSSLRLPNTLGSLAYESREICWVITKDGLILKANYKNNPPRWEMLSSVQDPCPDALKYFIAWDQKRGRLVVLRQRPDAEDGSCQCQFEFYRPLVKIVGLTDPVPVNRHRAGDLVEFVAHLYGDAGEGVTPYRIIGSLQAPAQGSLLRAESSSAWNGAISLLYQAPVTDGEDTLILEASINDGAL